ncbi:hypothetical protein NST02_02375 [Robertmurraya sp. FSL W8-0741]|uniref:hypothetical protein n=1 Tax=Robertmurraya TaxID=2837507 RepID=UPI0010F99EEE|nr:hypothetical protein [Robertmurraya siralis]
MSIEKNKYKFKEMLKVYGFSKLIFCHEFYISLMIPTFLFYLMFYIDSLHLKGIILEISKVLIAADIAMMAIVISGFAIILSVSNNNFLFFLNRKNLYIRFFFPFYLSSVLWSWHAILSIGMYLVVSTSLEDDFFLLMLIFIFYLYIFLFFYALLNSVSLVKTILRLGFEKVRLDDTLGKIEPKLKINGSDDKCEPRRKPPES